VSTLTPPRDAPGPPADGDPPRRPPAPPIPPSGRARRGVVPPRGPWRRGLAVAALAVVAVVVIVLFTRSSSDTYRFDFADAGQLVDGDLVRIGGTPAGHVDRITLTDNGQAQVEVSLDSSFAPLRRGTTAAIRNPGVTDVASRYLDVSPAPSFRPALPDGATIPATQTSGIVDIDEVFNSLNRPTRQGLRGVIRGFADWYRAESGAANRTSRYLPAALSAYSGLFHQVDASTPALRRFVAQTDLALGRLDARAPQLTDLISRARTTVDALAADNRSLSTGLAELPAALRHGTSALRALRTRALPALGRLSDATAPAIVPLRRLLPKLTPVLEEAAPTFTLLRSAIDRPGPDNDLYDALRVLPTVGGDVRQDFPRAIEALHKAVPIFQYARPYFPDLVAWLVNWDGIFAPYDANGHYARTLPVFDAYGLADGGQTLTPTPPGQRGITGLRTGLTNRCPGSAVATGDNSGDYVDRGPQANPHCDPAEGGG
jgi:phospholipid/cholesterol/gamma-HCH transport system substrate-binding protein